MKRPNLMLTVALAVTLILGVLGAALAQNAADKTVATVNGQKLSEATFLKVLEARYGERCLNALASNLVIQQAAKAANVKVTQDELERRFVATERSVELRAPMSGENFEMWLAKRSLTREYFRTELYHQMLLEKMVESQVKVTDEDVANYYTRNKERFEEPAMVRVAHICVQDQKTALQIRADIVSGKIDWNKAVKDFTLDPWTKDNNGDMGFLEMADTPFHKAAFALKANGDISDPVESPMGWHIIKRLAYREQRTPPFDEVQQSLREELEHSQLTRLAGQKRQTLLEAAKVERSWQQPTEDMPPVADPKPATPAPAPAPAQ